jgi:hypothetical protein
MKTPEVKHSGNTIPSTTSCAASASSMSEPTDEAEAADSNELTREKRLECLRVARRVFCKPAG